MSWEVIIDPVARKQLKRIPRKIAYRILNVIEQMAVNPYAGDIEKMEAENDVWRRRVGSYQIFYEVYADKRIVYVLETKRRTSSTY